MQTPEATYRLGSAGCLRLLRACCLGLALLAGWLAPALAQTGATQGVLTLDAPALSELPRRFRTAAFPLAVPAGSPALSRQGLDGLRVSGSSQFSLPQLAVLQANLPGRVTVVDLRRESHGFLGGEAVSWRVPDNQGNPGLEAVAVAGAEAGLLAAVDALPGVIVARDKDAGQDAAKGQGGSDSLTLGPLPAVTEAEAAASLGLGYFRLPVSDHTRPSDGVVDRFVRFYRGLAPQTWLHFHCRGGAGRTTTFLCLVDMLQNAREVDFAAILARQKALGGTDLTRTAGGQTPARDRLAQERLDFLRRFYDYAMANPDGRGQSWSQWLAGNCRP
ncbi:phosphatase domain-containing putative toxin [Desulfovibrio sp. TomC]|uniref:phosphatase domain-containing putative toxin n=1 Tax=Desulfovibrio sp. TomC TaxID=1562888 RepID=UPI000574EF02|nr:hypothetical protein [Desulfovibrio sp. TomC]KHK01041.1 Protein tyrosine phosphatase II superfamily protein [Desulfovibrio sp. TomC]